MSLRSDRLNDRLGDDDVLLHHGHDFPRVNNDIGVPNAKGAMLVDRIYPLLQELTLASVPLRILPLYFDDKVLSIR